MVIMHVSRSGLAIAGVLALTFAIAFAAYPSVPDPMATHWGFSGQVNGYLPKIWGLFVFPGISVALSLLFLAIPRIDPLRANIAKFRATYDHFVIVILIFLLYVFLLTITWNLGLRFNIGQLLSPAFGVLLYACGILVGRARQNWFIGIRTPWTLSSEKVWDRTHALGGKLFRIAAVLALPGALIPSLAFIFILGPVLVISVYLVVYSYLEYRKEMGAGPAGTGTP
jgi:uncharacterized membrane protein